MRVRKLPRRRLPAGRHLQATVVAVHVDHDRLEKTTTNDEAPRDFVVLLFFERRHAQDQEEASARHASQTKLAGITGVCAKPARAFVPSHRCLAQVPGRAAVRRRPACSRSHLLHVLCQQHALVLPPGFAKTNGVMNGTKWTGQVRGFCFKCHCHHPKYESFCAIVCFAFQDLIRDPSPLPLAF